MRHQAIRSIRYCILIAEIILLATTAGCKRDPFHDADVTDINLSLDISRFETDLFTADPSLIERYIPVWKEEYGIFFHHFNHVLGLGNSDDPEYAGRLRSFVTNPFHYRIYKRTMEIFPGLDSISNALTRAFKRYLYYFPDRTVPRIITYVSGFNQTAISDDSLLAVGLDHFLGSREDLYGEVGIYQYLMQNMHPQKLASDCMLFWSETEFEYNDSANNLISNMIYRGKLMYLVHMLLPDEPDTILWGFSRDELDFCINNEKQMWTYLVSNKLLFSTDRLTINKFILEGPFTTDFSRESPGRAAVWIGYRIVDRFMKKNPGFTIKDLMNKDDAMEILNLSAYNP
ncbi:MAG: hypothetical protein JXA61_05455 [Bacteroidales bacterium]|nr:hypothetical protein [Bacteroidales bacterium]